MEIVNENIWNNFEKATKYNIKSYFDSYFDFIDNHYSNVLNFYSGTSNVSPQESFDLLDDLLRKNSIIVEVFESNSNKLIGYDYWILLEQLESSGESLLTIKNLPKYLKSTITQSSYTSGTRLSYAAKQNETLESIQRNVADSGNPDSWVNLALDNNLKETDYTSEGGYIVKVRTNNSNKFTLNSVAKGISELNDIYGVDIDKKITFVDSDLKILTERETLDQTVEILVSLRKGDDPFFPNTGLDSKLAVGNNIAGISYPIIFRQILDVFRTDDSFKSVAIKNLKQEQDAIFIDIEIETRANEYIEQSITI